MIKFLERYYVGAVYLCGILLGFTAGYGVGSLVQ